MNKIFKVVWSEARNAYVVVSEIAKNHGSKSCSTKKLLTMLIATGVLMNLPSDQLESARVDGATNFQIFRKITMPYLLFVTGPALITDFVKNINNFNVIYLLTQDVYTTTNQAMASSQAKEVDLLVTWLFRLTQDYYNYKMASAIGIIVFIICAVFTLVAFNRMIKGDKEGTYQ